MHLPRSPAELRMLVFGGGGGTALVPIAKYRDRLALILGPADLLAGSLHGWVLWGVPFMLYHWDM